MFVIVKNCSSKLKVSKIKRYAFLSLVLLGSTAVSSKAMENPNHQENQNQCDLERILEDRIIMNDTDIECYKSSLTDAKKDLDKLLIMFKEAKEIGVLKCLIALNKELNINTEYMKNDLERLIKISGGGNPKLKQKIEDRVDKNICLKSERDELLKNPQISNFLLNTESEINRIKKCIKEALYKLEESGIIDQFLDQEMLVFIDEVKDLLVLVPEIKNTNEPKINIFEKWEEYEDKNLKTIIGNACPYLDSDHRLSISAVEELGKIPLCERKRLIEIALPFSLDYYEWSFAEIIECLGTWNADDREKVSTIAKSIMKAPRNGRLFCNILNCFKKNGIQECLKIIDYVSPLFANEKDDKKFSGDQFELVMKKITKFPIEKRKIVIDQIFPLMRKHNSIAEFCKILDVLALLPNSEQNTMLKLVSSCKKEIITYCGTKNLIIFLSLFPEAERENALPTIVNCLQDITSEELNGPEGIEVYAGGSYFSEKVRDIISLFPENISTKYIKNVCDFLSNGYDSCGSVLSSILGEICVENRIEAFLIFVECQKEIEDKELQEIFFKSCRDLISCFSEKQCIKMLPDLVCYSKKLSANIYKELFAYQDIYVLPELLKCFDEKDRIAIFPILLKHLGQCANNNASMIAPVLKCFPIENRERLIPTIVDILNTYPNIDISAKNLSDDLSLFHQEHHEDLLPIILKFHNEAPGNWARGARDSVIDCLRSCPETDRHRFVSFLIHIFVDSHRKLKEPIHTDLQELSPECWSTSTEDLMGHLFDYWRARIQSHQMNAESLSQLILDHHVGLGIDINSDIYVVAHNFMVEQEIQNREEQNLLQQNQQFNQSYETENQLVRTKRSEIVDLKSFFLQAIECPLMSKKLWLNPFYIKEISNTGITFGQLPKYPSNFLNDITVELDQINMDHFDEFSNEILLLTASPDYEDLKRGALGDSYVANILGINGTDNDIVPVITSKLVACIVFLNNLSDEPQPGKLLNKKQEAFLMFLASIRKCSIGKHEGICAYYQLLPLHSKFSKMNDSFNDEKGEKAKEFLNGILREEIEKMFNGQNQFFKELVGPDGLNQENEISQAVHQALYVKNVLGDEVSLVHEYTNDPHISMVSPNLWNMNKEEVLQIFYDHFLPDVLIKAVLRKVNGELLNQIPHPCFWLSDLIEKEYAENCFSLDLEGCPLEESGAMLLLHKLGVLSDLEAINKLYKAQFSSAVIYGNGLLGEEKNKDGALYWFVEAARRGHKGVFETIHEMAEQGNLDAQVVLGNFYEEGSVVEQEQDTALMWYQKAAENGHGEAQYHLGFIFSDGCLGVEIDLHKSRKYYNQAAEQGYPGALFLLGLWSFHGYENGCDQNYEKAFCCFMREANKGHQRAQKMIDHMRENNMIDDTRESELMNEMRENGEID